MSEFVAELMKTPDGIQIAYHSRFRFELVSHISRVAIILEYMVQNHIVPNNPLGWRGESGDLLNLFSVVSFFVFSQLFFRRKPKNQKHSDKEYYYNNKKEIFHERESKMYLCRKYSSEFFSSNRESVNCSSVKIHWNRLESSITVLYSI